MTKTIAKIACDGMTTTFLKSFAENIGLIHTYAFRKIKDAISAFFLCILAIARSHYHSLIWRPEKEHYGDGC
jgi:hypothetical protein